MQREPTAISLVAMATPTMPVRSHRPTRENVVNSMPITRRPRARPRALLGDARGDVVLRALVEAGVDHRGDLLAGDQVDHDRGRPVAHFEWALADLDVAAAGLEGFDLGRQGVTGHDHQGLALQLVHDLAGDLRVRLRGELGPAP